MINSKLYTKDTMLFVHAIVENLAITQIHPQVFKTKVKAH
jgi:hypothetical protein